VEEVLERWEVAERGWKVAEGVGRGGRSREGPLGVGSASR